MLYALLDGYESSLSNKFDINSGSGSYDLATDADTAGTFLSSMMPMLLMIFLFSGCMSTAPESIAGEKERGTIATLLITPLRRRDLALGKICCLVHHRPALRPFQHRGYPAVHAYPHADGGQCGCRLYSSPLPGAVPHHLVHGAVHRGLHLPHLRLCQDHQRSPNLCHSPDDPVHGGGGHRHVRRRSPVPSCGPTSSPSTTASRSWWASSPWS